MSITAVKGFNDILPGDTELWRHIEETAYYLFRAYGFSEIRLPIVEKTELFLRSIGETTDIVEKEMYTFADRHGDSITLRPEGTAPAVRAYIEHKLYTSAVTRLYYTGPMFRYERPQKGRYRQFYQIGAEVFGEASPRADAESLVMLMKLFERLGVMGATLQINSLGCAECRPAYKEKLYNYLKGKAGSLCENCLRRIDTNPLRALDCKVPGCIEATKDAPSIVESLCAPCKEHFDRVEYFLGLTGITPVVNPRMVRGLDYYTRTTFEVTADTGLGSQNTVAAGGRYDNLVSELGGPATPCFGFALGIERLALIMQGRAPKEPVTVFIAMGDEAERKGVELVAAWRRAGIRVIEEFSAGGLKGRMKRADRLGADYVVILGENELASGVISVKDMKKAEQATVAWDRALEIISAQK
ncbi:MAG TPA: histidine--tRNA ligase [Deltaproteobacteria bacterium]|nr:MAG: histidine--tRNA ligase [Deltaproteobacteria bacterium GWA2_55_82]OIJ73802.1 MAG: histidine--tRNA ligase [Deltaproteobacteria bacterium GWC2_55_46]HBG45793.1 histidine--tRNA ligase [Deltaproteobacteria bacterium]HCY09788.1 histidine--tRNA ligase [Deltaproteobacteria bacterium]